LKDLNILKKGKVTMLLKEVAALGGSLVWKVEFILNLYICLKLYNVLNSSIPVSENFN